MTTTDAALVTATAIIVVVSFATGLYLGRRLALAQLCQLVKQEWRERYIDPDTAQAILVVAMGWTTTAAAEFLHA